MINHHCTRQPRFTITGTSALLTFIFTLLSISHALATDWPQWRGPSRNSVSAESGLMTSWTSAAPTQAWHVAGLGEGYSSVVIAAGRVFTTGRIGKDVHCFALQADSGRELWSTRIGTTTRNVMSTPTVHGDLVYALDPDGELTCLSVQDGHIIWQRSFLEDFGGRLMSGRGYGESVLIDGDRLVCTPGGEQAMLVALNRLTGEVIWQAEIPAIGEKGRDGAAFSSIVITKAAGVRQYVQLTGRGLIGIEAETGRFLWGYNDISNTTANIPTPIVQNDLVFSANGYHAGSVLLKIVPTEGETGVSAKEIYRLAGNKYQNHHGGFVLLGDHIYGGHGSNNGLPTCLQLDSGRIVWKSRGPGTGSASVVAADGHLYFRYQDGVVALIEASPAGYSFKGSFKVPGAGGDSWSHPVISNGKLYLRENEDLWVYNVRTSTSATVAGSTPSKPTAQHEKLAKMGVVVEAFNAKTTNTRHNRLYQFAFDAKNSVPSINVVTLSDRHINEKGAISAAPFQLLQELEKPFVLNLAGTRIGNLALEQATTLKQLTGINVELCRELNDDSFAFLEQAKQLRVVVAAGTNLTEHGLVGIARLPHLAALDLEYCDHVADSACEVIATMQNLRGLSLQKTGFEKLKVTDAGTAKLALNSKLESLNLSGNGVTDDGLKNLQALTNLRALYLNRLPIKDPGLAALLPLHKLEELQLIYTEGFAGPKLTNAGMPALSQLGQLKTLNLIGAHITDDSLAKLSKLQQLQHLTVIDTQLSATGIDQLQKMLPNCKVVSELRSE